MKLILLACLSPYLWASGLTTSAYVKATTGLNIVEDTESGTDVAHAHASLPDAFGDMVSTANFGSLSLIGMAMGGNDTALWGSAYFTDSMTILGGGGQGVLRWTIASNCASYDIICTASETGTLHLLTQSSFTFTYGVPFYFGLSMQASDHGGFDQLSENLSIHGFRVDNAPDTLMYKTDSGAAYNFAGVQHIMLEGPVVHNPEPGTWWTLAGGGVLIILGKMKKAQWGNWASKEDSTI